MRLHVNPSRTETLVDICYNATSVHTNKTAVVTQDGIRYTYAELQKQALQITNALRNQGIKKGDPIALFIENVPEFLPANIGTLYAGGISVLMNPETNPREAINERLEFVEPKLILTLEKNIERLREHNKRKIPVISFEEALKGKRADYPTKIDPDDHATYIFSSGTTGIKDDKVIMLSHRNIASNIIAADSVLTPVTNGIYLTGIADNTHSFEHLLQLWMLHNGMQLHYTNLFGFMNGTMAKIQPHYLIIIPRTANIIMDRIKKKFDRLGLRGMLEKVVEQSTSYYRAVLRHEQPDSKAKLVHKLADLTLYAIVRKKLRKQFGKNIKEMIGGSAILPAKTQEFFLAIGHENFWINQGYGLSETSPAISVNRKDNYRIDPGNYGIGSSGRVLPGIKVLIVNPDELLNDGHIVPLEDGREGMLLVQGPNVFRGYLKNKRKTEEAFVNGWFITGDRAIKERVADGSDLGPFLYVSGRYKDLIVFNNGQKLAPELMQTEYETKAGNLISRFICVGDGRSHLTALVIPQEEIRCKILRGETTEGEVVRQIEEKLKDAQKNFGYAVRRIALDLYFDPIKYETNLKKFKKDAYLADRSDLIESLYL